MHGDYPVGLDHRFPDLRENDLTIWADKVVMALSHVGAYYFDVEKSLLYEIFHSL